MASFSSLRAGSEAVVGPDPRGREHGPGDAARRFPRRERTVATARPGPRARAADTDAKERDTVRTGCPWPLGARDTGGGEDASPRGRGWGARGGTQPPGPGYGRFHVRSLICAVRPNMDAAPRIPDPLVPTRGLSRPCPRLGPAPSRRAFVRRSGGPERRPDTDYGHCGAADQRCPAVRPGLQGPRAVSGRLGSVRRMERLSG